MAIIRSWSTVVRLFILIMSAAAIMLVSSNAKAQAVKEGTAETQIARERSAETIRGGCTPEWAYGPSANADNANNRLNGVVAPATNDVWAVGTHEVYGPGNGFNNRTLIEHFDGLKWTALDSPNNGNYENNLLGVAASGSSNVWAVGSYYDGVSGLTRTLAMRWNGTAWSIVSSPNAGAGNNYLTSVTTLGQNDAWAVGYYIGGGSAKRTLIEHWNGTTWTLVNSPNSGSNHNELTGVTGGANDAWAVGSYELSNGIGQTLIEHWNGTSWSVSFSQNQGGYSSYLQSVSKLSSSSAWAVGYYIDNSGGTPLHRTLVERWDGGTWSLASSPNVPSTSSSLYSVAAYSANDVWAVGDFHVQTANHTLAMHWNGTQWSIELTPDVQSGGALASVSVLQPNQVYAVGFVEAAVDGGTVQNTLAELKDSAGWNVRTTPNAHVANLLTDVDGSAPADMWAVGNSTLDNGSHTRRTLIEHWDGTNWTRIVSPNATTGDNVLLSVKVISATDAWAAGYSLAFGSTQLKTLAMHWNGTQWSIVNTPNSGVTSSFASISASSTSDVWAVGNYGTNGNVRRTLVEHWNGTSWSIVNTPNVSAENNFLYDVDVVPGTNGTSAWAVGFYEDNGLSYSLIERWNGSTWTLAASPSLTDPSTLNSISASSATDAWAVGYILTGGHSHSLTMHWNGTLWAVVSSPNPGTDATLNGVSALTATDVYAVGTYASGSKFVQLAMHWDGASWVVDPTVSPTSDNNDLLSVVTISPTEIWSAGYTTDGSGPVEAAQTLILKYNSCTDSCAVQFTDVPVGSTFYSYINCLACQGTISGYPDGTFRPGENVTRGQAAKIIANAAGYSESIPVGTQSFVDVAPGSTFYTYIERVKLHGAIAGYACGGAGEPCPGSYFRPGSNLTRGQLAKISIIAAGYTDPVTTQTFVDVPVGSSFYVYVERAYIHGVLDGYPCGQAGEPCPGSYFRPQNNVTRGQTAKIVSNTFFPGCGVKTAEKP